MCLGREWKQADQVCRKIAQIRPSLMLTPNAHLMLMMLTNDGPESLNRTETRALLRSLRLWVEDRLNSRTILETT